MNFTRNNGHIILKTQYQNRPLHIETGHLATQATSSVKVSLGGTTVLATLVIGKPRAGGDYLPLQVVYEERFYASGKMKDSLFNKREGRPSDTAVLNGRLIDRSLRSSIYKQCRNEMQLVITVLEVDKETKPEILGTLAGSIAFKLARLEGEGALFSYNSYDIVGFDIATNTCFSIDKSNITHDMKLRTTISELFTNDSTTIDIIKPSATRTHAIAVISGITKKGTSLTEPAKDISELALQAAAIKKRFIIEPKNTIDQNTLTDKDIVAYTSQELFKDPISSIRIGVAKSSVLKGYISSLLNAAKDNQPDSDISDICISVIQHSLYNSEIKEFVETKLQEINQSYKDIFSILHETISEKGFASRTKGIINEDQLQYYINPTYSQIEQSDMEIVVSGSKGSITMIETGAQMLPQHVIFAGIERAVTEINTLCSVQQEFIDYTLSQ